MNEWRAWRALAVMTAAFYGSLAWVWFAELVPGAGGLTPFDGRLLGYTAEEGRAYLAALSDPAREVYLGTIRTLDTLFPTCLATLLAWPLWRLPAGVLRLLALLPMGYLAADLVENALVAALLRSDQTVASHAIEAASRLTVTKYALLIASVIALAGVFVTTRRK